MFTLLKYKLIYKSLPGTVLCGKPTTKGIVGRLRVC